MMRGIARYGFDTNPFINGGALDPLANSEDAELLDGIPGLAEAEALIDRCRAKGQTAYVLVSGKRGAGRTSVCNRLLAHYRAELDFSPEHFIVPEREFSGEDHHFVWLSWMTSMYYEALGRGLVPLDAGGFKLDEILQTGKTLEDRQRYTTAGRYVMKACSEVLRAKKAAFAVCLARIVQ
jgi:hypothetical protein